MGDSHVGFRKAGENQQLVIFLFNMSSALPPKEESLLSGAATVIQHLLPSDLGYQR